MRTADLTAFRSARLALLAGAALCALASSAFAQTAQAPAEAAAEQHDPTTDDNEVSEVTVTASREQRGAVVGDIPPEIQLSPRDIRAYGVSSVAELVTALAPQTGSVRGRSAGRPVILLNGVRTSSFAEVRDLPTEAIARVDVLSEEVALKYGYRADQRVINIVLRPRFRALTAEGGYTASTQSGGGDAAEAKANLLRIRQNDRLQLSASLSGQNPLLESDRSLAQPRADAPFRTLLPEQRAASFNGVLSRSLGEGTSATINASSDLSRSEARLGVDPLSPRPLQRQTETLDGHLGATVAGAVKGWRWTVTGNADRTRTDTDTERALGAVTFVDRSNAISTSADAEVVLNGAVVALPAGPLSATLTGGLETLNYETESRRAGALRSGELSRDTASAKANIDIPITSRREDVLAAVGDISLNVNAATDELSDFGTLSSIGGGVNWSPFERWRLIASFTEEDGAPTVQQLGDPELVTPGVQVYDFRTGGTANVSTVTGGARTLRADNRQVLKLGLNARPWESVDVNFTADYVKSRTEDVISSFPTATTQLEAAFPERFLRDASGTLVQIDARPVNFDRRDTEEVRYGFTYRRPFGPQPQPGQGGGRQRQGGGGQAQGGAPAGGPPPEGGPPPGGGAGGPGGPGGPGGGFGGLPGGFGGMRGVGGGNFQVGLYHTIKLKDEIVIRPGAPTLDLLNGAAIGSAGGEPQNQIDLQANISRRGLGAALNAKWQEGTVVRGSGAAGSEDLFFSDLTTVNLRLFADLTLQPWFRERTFFRGSRVTLAITNITDEKQQVRTASGATPISYQEDYLDPQGRTVKLSFRKLFF